MTTSNTTTWELNRNELIEQAFARLGIPGEDNTLSSAQYTDGNTAVNMAISMAITDGMPLWKRTTTSLTPSTTSQVYSLDAAVKVSAVYIRDVGGVQYALQNKSLYDFMALPRNAEGTPVNWTFQPTISGGTLSIWPLTSDSTTVANKTIQVVYQKKFDGFTASTETLDMPSYWLTPMVYRTAVFLAPIYGVPLPDRQELKKELAEYWAMAKGYGDEDGSFFFQPARRY